MIVDDMSYFESWAQGFGCYEQLRVMNDMNNSGSLELRPLDALNNSGLWMTWATQGHELRILWAKSSIIYELLKPLVHMNDSRSWAQGSRWCYEQLKVMDEMNELWSHVLKLIDSMNNSRLWMTWMTLGRVLRAQDAMKSSELWLRWIT